MEECRVRFVFITVEIIISMEQQKIHKFINVFEEFGLIFPGIFKNLPQNIVKWAIPLLIGTLLNKLQIWYIYT